MSELSEVKYIEGSGGGGSSKTPDAPTNTPDNLFSEDIVEFALAISEGPIRGLARGAKSFFVGDTPLVSEEGTANFQKFAIGVHPGYPEGVAQELNLVLGGESSNSSVNVLLYQNVPVVRQTSEILRNTIDEIEVRIMFQRLMQTTNSGTFNATALFSVEYKKITDDIWSYIPASGFRFENVPAHWVVENGTPVFRYVSDGEAVPLDFIPENSYEYNGTNVTTAQRQTSIGEGTIAVTGKTSSGYVKEFKVAVPRIDTDWEIRVTKLSPDHSTTDYIDMAWESFQCTTKTPQAYPNTAIVHGVGVATGQFSSIPTFSGIWDGMLFRVPTNYNPDLRTYDDSTPWDGSFKFAWTNNPAWVLYGLIVDTRYGLAAHYPYVDANRFDFYEAARWCDELVPSLIDPEVMEPRFTYNDVIAEPRDAKEMLNYIAGSFNAFIWDDLSGKIHLRVDRDDAAVMLFSPENITDEGFNYTFTDITTRVNDVSVAFVNPDLDWNEDRRRIPDVTTDEDDIREHGRIPLDFIAVGCTNVSEAVRKARYRLISAQTETMMVSFTTTRLAAYLQLFDVILIADPTMGWSQSGRITHFDADYLYLRDPIYIEQLVDYTIKFQTPLGIVEKTVTAEQTGDVYRLHFEDSTPDFLPKNAVFTLEQAGGFGYAKPFRVMSVEDVDGSPYLFQITAIELNRSKYSSVETGDTVPELQYSFSTTGSAPAPQNVVILSGSNQCEILPNGTINYRFEVAWVEPRGALIDRYEASWSNINESTWTDVPPTSGSNFYVDNVLPGQVYVARVRSVDPYGNRSPWTYSLNHTIMGLGENPEPVTSFTASGQDFQNHLEWTYDNSPAILSVEVFAANTNDINSAVRITEEAYPTSTYTHNGLGVATQVFYWIRVKNREARFSDYTGPISAITNSDPSTLMEMLTDSITENELSSDLRSTIDLVTAPSSVPGSVNARVSEEETNRNIALNVEARQRLESENATAEAVLNNALATHAEVVDRQSDIASARTELTENFQAGISAEATARTQLETKLTSADAVTNARIDDEQTARSTADTAEATARQALAVQFRGNYEGTDLTQVTSGLIYQADQARASGDAALAQQLTLLSAGAGEQFDWQSIWYFDTGVENWSGNGTPTVTNGWLRAANQVSGAYVNSPTGVAADGNKYAQVRLRIRKTGTPTFAGYLWWKAVGDTTWDVSRRIALTEPTYDSNNIGLITQNLTWAVTVDQIRVDLSDAQTASNYFEIDWVAVGRPSPGASSAQLLDLQKATTDVGTSTSLVNKITALDSKLNDPNTGLDKTRSTLSTDYYTKTSADSATASAQQTLVTEFQNRSSHTFRQGSAPVQGTQTITLKDGTTASIAIIKTGDRWENTSDGNKPHTWDGSQWVYTPDTSAAASAAYTNSLESALANSSGATVTSWRQAVADVLDPETGLAQIHTELVQAQDQVASETQARVADTKRLTAASDADAETALRMLVAGEDFRNNTNATIAEVYEELQTNITQGLLAEASKREVLAVVVDQNSASLIQNYYTKSATDLSTASAQQTLLAEYRSGSNNVYRQASAPTQSTYTVTLANGQQSSPVNRLRNNDIWYDSDDGNKPYVWDDATQTWIYSPDTSSAASQAYINSLDTALATATSSNVVLWRQAVSKIDIPEGSLVARFNTLETTKIGYATKAGIPFDNDGAITDASGVTAWNTAHPTDLAVWHVGLPFATSVKQVMIDDGTGNTVALEQRFVAQKDTNNNLLGKYTVKIDQNGYVSGFGLASTANNGTPTSAFIVNADSFAVGKPGVTNKYPFIVGMVGGQTAVGIDGTLVVDGTITATKIDTRGLTVKDTSGNVIFSAGTALDYSRVGGATRPADNATVGATIGTNLGGQFSTENIGTYFANGVIGNAYIGNVIQSTNFTTGAGGTGWKIDKNGDIELNSATFRGTIDIKSAANGARLEVKNDVIKVYDSNGVLRVRLGNLSA